MVTSCCILRPPTNPVMRSYFNDIDEDLINFFKVLREKPHYLFGAVYYLPYSRKLREELKKIYYNRDEWLCLDDISRAAYFFYLCNLSMNGVFQSGFRTSKVNKNEAVGYNKRIFRIFEVAERFKSVIIENLDFEKCIKKYDTKKTLFYCDPPYFDDIKITRRRYYRHRFSTEDHKRLSNILNQIRGMACVSYMYHPILEKLYPREKWIWKEKQCKTFTRPTPAGKRSSRIELLIMNYRVDV